jgi:hypothetical protein
MLMRYPLEDPGHFAQGAIQSKANSNLCLEVPKGQKKVVVASCEKNLIRPSVKQFFKLTWHRNIQHHLYDFCLQSSLTVSECHFSGTNQFWKYDLVKSLIVVNNILRCYFKILLGNVATDTNSKKHHKMLVSKLKQQCCFNRNV